MARLVQQALLEFIRPVQLLTVEADEKTGAISGRFRSGPLLFDYTIKGEKVSYRPLGSGEKGAKAAGEAARPTEAPRTPAANEGDPPAPELEPQKGRADAIEDAGRDSWVRRGVRFLAGLWNQPEARVDAFLAAEVRMDAAAGAKRCTTGYQCGSTCIARSKVCLVEMRGKGVSKRLAELTQSHLLQKGGADRGDLKHEKLKAERVALGKQLIARLEQQRPDGMGTFMENPDDATFALIADAAQKREEVDRKLNRLEGRPAEEKRWYEDSEELGLSRYQEQADASESPLGAGRTAYEKKVVDSFLEKGAPGNQAVFMAGGPASGKTSLLKAKFGQNPEGFVTVDPDAIKGRLPEMLVGVAMGVRDAAAITHEQSSRISKQILPAAQAAGLNFIMDGTGANVPKYVRQMGEARDKGYTVSLLMQHVEMKVGVERALTRADKVGRYVPREFIEDAYKKLPYAWEKLSAAADRATLNDSDSNTELAAVISGRTVAAAGPAFRQFMRRYPQR